MDTAHFSERFLRDGGSVVGATIRETSLVNALLHQFPLPRDGITIVVDSSKSMRSDYMSLTLTL